MAEFKISESRVNLITRRFFFVLGTAYFILIAVLSTMYVDYGSVSDIVVLAFACIFCPLMLYAITKWIKTSNASYTLNITDNTITREQKNLPAITLYFTEITKIEQLKNGDYYVTGPDKRSLIIIPRDIEHAGELKEKLNKIIPITAQPSKTYIKIRILLVLYLFSLAAVVGYIALGTNEYIVNVLKALFIALVFGCYVYLIRVRNLDKRIKIFCWIMVTIFTLGAVQGLLMWLIS